MTKLDTINQDQPLEWNIL